MVNNNPPSAKSSAPEKSSYNAAAARKFFESAGEEVEVEAGETIFAEEDKESWLFFQRDKMYLLVQGEIALTVRDKHVGTVKEGEIFGELASITNSARSATAKAVTWCKLIALDEKQFKAALRADPEFALTLMGLMVGRLRRLIAELNTEGAQFAGDKWNESGALSKKQLAGLQDEIGNGAIAFYPQGKGILQEGQVGMLMYVVLEGSVEVAIKGSVVEKIGPGGMFGEMALIGGTERLASAVAETDCSLLAIKRKTFLELLKDKPEFGVALLNAVGERARFMVSRFAK